MKYAVEVFINGKWMKLFRNADLEAAEEEALKFPHRGARVVKDPNPWNDDQCAHPAEKKRGCPHNPS